MRKEMIIVNRDMEYRHKIIVLIIVIYLIVLPLKLYGAKKRKRLSRHSIKWEGYNRTYLLYVPESLKKDNKVPLLLALHGGGGTGAKMVGFTMGKYNRLADKEGFIVVYPDGFEKHWNDGRGLTRYRSQKENVDDVGFLTALIDHLIRTKNVDRSRVYMTGASNGALMSYRMALEKTDRLAAIAAVICPMGERISKKVKPKKPISVMIMNGTKDPLAPYNGGDLHFRRLKLGKVLSTDATAKFWAKNNACSLKPKVTNLPDKDPNDGTKIRKKEYTGGKEGTEVILYIVEGGGHTSPGGRQYLPERIIGKTSKDIDACEVIWNFFKKHRRRSSP